MSKSLTLARLLLITSALVAPPALAQADNAAPQPATSAGEPPVADAPAAGEEEAPEVSIPGGDIVVLGRRDSNLVKAAPQVVSVLSSADIARTGEGNIAGALQRVTGLSVVGSGYVYVRGLGDRYSLALLNGSPLPSPEPLKRVVPLDIFPTSVLASSLVQKSYSANFPGEFGGGVINLTTRALPTETFFQVSGSVSGDTETTTNRGYTYYGSGSDWTGFDDGTRDVPPLLKAAFASGKPVLEGADFTAAQLTAMQLELVNARTSLLQMNNDIPFNFSGSITGGTSIDLGGSTLGILATAGISNKWRTRATLQQTAGAQDLSGPPQTNYNRVITDNRVIVNGLLGLGLEFGDNTIRWTNLFIRDALKQARLAVGTDLSAPGRDFMRQDTAWYERQLIDTQVVAEFKFGDLDVDLRGGYANSQREAPYERNFTYVRTNQPLNVDPVGNRFVNDLGGTKQGDADISFSDLNEDLWSAGVDLSYPLVPEMLTASVGYAFTDTHRVSVRRSLQFRAANLPIPVQQLRPDYLLSDSAIQYFGISVLETSAQDGTAAFDAKLRTHAGYAQANVKALESLDATLGVRYETADQSVAPVDLFNTGGSAIVRTSLSKSYWLPAITLTWEVQPDLQVRVSGSKTIARPQFRELVRQIYQDTDSNRQFRGNPSLVDSELLNAEARVEWFFDRDQRLTLAGFFKKIDKPIETFSSDTGNGIETSFANAPSANLWGIEFEAQKYFPLMDWFSGAFWESRRMVLVANYTFSKSRISVGAGDTTMLNGVTLPSTTFFVDGSPMTGQSKHLANFQIGLEDMESLSQITLLAAYSSPRVTSRGPNLQPDIKEKPGLTLDIVARQGIKIGSDREIELKAELRNITGRDYQELQELGANKIYYNRYKVGTSYSLGASIKF